MPTVARRLTEITLKIERAKKHIADLQEEVGRFIESEPYGVAIKRDPQSRKLIYYVSSVKSTPVCLPLIAGDAIQNLRSALDHLAYQIVSSDTGDAPPNPTKIDFPIADSADKYNSAKGEKLKGATRASIDAIDALKPFKGGNDALWSLSRLNNIDKHRLLFTVGSYAAGVHLVDFIVSAGARTQAEMAPLKDAHIFLNPTEKGFPLKVGFELLITGPDAEPNPNQKFRFGIALNEPGIVESTSILDTLNQFSARVEGILTDLTPTLRDTP
jgi:hypothetical protein